ncbi:hypothetical protein LSAT2_003253 [Lamellibrachia satsuma]|nr:hypothetical protein LSAT2_003253 [Lamellibrachia satsuma]
MSIFCNHSAKNGNDSTALEKLSRTCCAEWDGCPEVPETMPPKYIRINKNVREHKWKQQLFQAVVANEQWSVVQEIINHLGPNVDLCIETTVSCKHKLKFEMLNVPDGILLQYDDGRDDRCKSNKRERRRTRDSGDFSDKHPSQRRSTVFDMDGVLQRDSSASPAMIPPSQGHSVTSVDSPLRERPGNDTNSRHRPSQVGNNFRQQIGRVLGRIGKHSSQRYTAVSGHATSDKDERVGQADSPSRSSGRRRDTTFGHVNNRTGKEYSDVMSEGKPDSGQRQRHGSISCEGDVRKPGSDTYSLTRLGSTTGHGQASGFGDTLKNTFHSRRITIMNLVHILLTGYCSCVETPGVTDEDVVLAGVTPLNVASAFGHVQLVTALISNTVAAQAFTRHLNWSPLHTIAGCKVDGEVAVQIADLLLRGKVDVDARDLYGMTALHVACKHGNYHMAEFLTQQKCALNLLSLFGTPLNVSVARQDGRFVDLLLDAGADVAVANRFAPTPLVTAIQGRMVSVVEKILEKGVYDVNLMGQHTKDMCKVQHRVSLLHVAVMEGDKIDNVRIAEMLLESGAEANSAGQLATAPGRHFTPLILAAELGYVNMVKVLLQHRCRVNAVTDRGETALHKAAAEGQFQVCCLLIAAGAKPDAETYAQETPLTMAARRDHCSVLRLLLSQHVDPEHADCDLNTPAHLTAYNGCLMCLVALLRHGASADTPNSLMTTPLWNAVYMGHATLVDRLLKAGVYPAVPSTGMEPHLPGQPGALLYGWPKTPLQVATEKNRRAIMRVLQLVGCSLTGECRRTQLFGAGRLWHYALSSARSEARRRLSRPTSQLGAARARHQRLYTDLLNAKSRRRSSLVSGSLCIKQ